MKIGKFGLYDRVMLYIAGFVAGVVLAIIAATWDEITVAYRITYIGFLSLFLFATWFKPKSNKGNSNTDNRCLCVAVKSSNDSGDNATDS